jgi:hypothetical protein
MGFIVDIMKNYYRERERENKIVESFLRNLI